jgi:sterol desaturase/sphingolipid hydroxylase (fatty acid hydroxylase superfamily)
MLAFLSDAYSGGYGFVNALLIRLEYPAATCAAYLLFELLMPRSRNSARSYLQGACFVGTAVLVNTLVLTVAQATTGVQQNMPGMPGASQTATLFSLDLGRFTQSEDLGWRVFGWLAATIGIGLLADFFYYWMHRAQHGFGWMWRFHKVHHSITEMSATNSYHHVAEDLFQYVAVTLPLTFLLGVSAGPVPWLLIVVVNTHTYFIHSSANFNIGPLRYLLMDNRLHRIHHSREPQHMNHNFATRTPIWDILFGTAYFPRSAEWPSVGLADTAEPRTIRDYLLLPFRGAGMRAPQPALESARR